MAAVPVAVLLARTSKRWPRFTPPAPAGLMTVADVVRCAPAQRDEALRRWCATVWQEWKPDHVRVRHIIDALR